MNTLNATNGCLKFTCLYCGQRMECDPRLRGRQILCPACLHRLVIPTAQGGKTTMHPALVRYTWDTSVPLPRIENPCGGGHPACCRAVASSPAENGSKHSVRAETGHDHSGRQDAGPLRQAGCPPLQFTEFQLAH